MKTVEIRIKKTEKLLNLAPDRILFHLVIPKTNIFTRGYATHKWPTAFSHFTANTRIECGGQMNQTSALFSSKHSYIGPISALCRNIDVGDRYRADIYNCTVRLCSHVCTHIIRTHLSCTADISPMCSRHWADIGAI